MEKLEGFQTRDGQTIACHNLIVAAGAWSPKIVPQLRPYVRPSGQPVIHLKVQDAANFSGNNFPVFFADIDKVGMYGFPLTHNKLKIGNHGKGFPYKYGEPLEVTPVMKSMFSKWLREKLPWLSEAGADYRLCLYCDSWDSNFYIDRVPDVAGLMVACGGSGHGFKFTPVMGEIIADVYESKANTHVNLALFKWRTGEFLPETGLAPGCVPTSRL